jgi:hypothetical protein
VPLFDILEKYIYQLRELHADGPEANNGINFAEAAFIIQVITIIYVFQE